MQYLPHYIQVCHSALTKTVVDLVPLQGRHVDGRVVGIHLECQGLGEGCNSVELSERGQSL